jgi:hypothetical protein
MGLTETSVALAGCVLVLVVAITLDRRPYRPGKLNYIPLMIIALALRDPLPIGRIVMVKCPNRCCF